MKTLRRLTNNYDVTITFTLLSILNLTSWWGNLSYRVVMVLMNLVIGASMEYLVNRYSSTEKKNLYKGLTALGLLFTNIVWILVTLLK
ncbi:hypothetical protein [uncultured Lactobacillus sp.]|uniref:hypothetical protein n=1 Tax=uncultured Lactobacillus sp. TaxID=153152 RepID=UPI002629B96E|nr:hypothetical protein [uncultured Lactobacillus sp.]